MLAVFLSALAAFVLIILFLVWYAKLMANKIFGNMNAQLNAILDENRPPDEWNKRLQKITDGIKGDRKREKALKKYVRYVEASYKDILSYAEKTSFIQDDARPDVIFALERFMDDYKGSLRMQ